MSLMTLLFSWRRAIDWQNSLHLYRGLRRHESAHILGFVLAMFTLSVVKKYSPFLFAPARAAV